MLFEHDVAVSFGDCDPAGIVFYPNYFRWMDACFHAFLQDRAGGHAALCTALGARGLGLMEARLGFRAPVSEGMHLRYAIADITWSKRSLDVTYRATEGDRLVLEGHERRGVFVDDAAGRLRAAPVAPLRALLGA